MQHEFTKVGADIMANHVKFFFFCLSSQMTPMSGAESLKIIHIWTQAIKRGKKCRVEFLRGDLAAETPLVFHLSYQVNTCCSCLSSLLVKAGGSQGKLTKCMSNKYGAWLTHSVPADTPGSLVKDVASLQCKLEIRSWYYLTSDAPMS